MKALVKEVGAENVIGTDVSPNPIKLPCHYESLDICDQKKFEKIVKDNKITYIVHLAAILSALGERFPDKACAVNVDGFINAINIAREHSCKIFSPSTIAVYGGDVYNKVKTPLDSVLKPNTMYGVTKIFNEQLGEYYFKKFEVDFRCIRYPGVISSEKCGFNGTIAYATGINII